MKKYEFCGLLEIKNGVYFSVIKALKYYYACNVYNTGVAIHYIKNKPVKSVSLEGVYNILYDYYID